MIEQKPVDTTSAVSPANPSDECVLVFRSDYERPDGNMNEGNGEMRVRYRQGYTVCNSVLSSAYSTLRACSGPKILSVLDNQLPGWRNCHLPAAQITALCVGSTVAAAQLPSVSVAPNFRQEENFHSSCFVKDLDVISAKSRCVVARHLGFIADTTVKIFKM